MKQYSTTVSILPNFPSVDSAIVTTFVPAPKNVESSMRRQAVRTMYAQQHVRAKVEGMKPAATVFTGNAMMPAPMVPPAMRAIAPVRRSG